MNAHFPESNTTASPVTVRRATPDGSDTILVMMNEIAGAEAVGTVDVDPEHWRDLMHRDDLIVLLAGRDREPIGYVSAVIALKPWLGGEHLALDDLYVRPGHRDGGVGRTLMHALAAIARAAADDHPVGNGERQHRRPTPLHPPGREPAHQNDRRLASDRLPTIHRRLTSEVHSAVPEHERAAPKEGAFRC